MARVAAESHWCVTFCDVVDAVAMKVNFEKCVFFRKCATPVVLVVGSSVIFTFVAAIDKQGIQQKCTQTFKAYGDFRSHSIAEKTGQPERCKHRNSPKQIWKHFWKFPEINGWGVCGPMSKVPLSIGG